MAGTTTNFAFPYPTSTDYVKDGASNIQNLATSIDTYATNLWKNGTCILNGANAQAINNAVISNVLFGAGTETFDPNGWHSTTVNTDRITPTVAGYYLAIAKVTFNRAGAAARFANFIGKNGGFGEAENGFLGGDYPSPCCSVMLYMNGTTDYVASICYQQTGVAINLLNQQFSLTLVRRT